MRQYVRERVLTLKSVTYVALDLLFPPFRVLLVLLSKLRGCTDQWIIDIVGRASEHSVDSALDARSIPVHLHSTFDPWSPTKR